MKEEKNSKKVRGVFEKVPGSGDWWIQYFDAQGKRHREKAGSKSDAIDLYKLRKVAVLRREKLPEKLHHRVVLFSELAEDAKKYVNEYNLGARHDCCQIERLKAQFGTRHADIPKEDFLRWLSEQEWSAATFNRYKAKISLVYRLGIESGKVTSNPVRLIKRKREDNGRIRFLNQLKPFSTELDYLKKHSTEEARLLAVIETKYPDHMPEFEIAMHTGMRPSEQYALTWDRVNLSRRQLTIPKSKNGKARHIPLNSNALAAFKRLARRSLRNGPVFISRKGKKLDGYKHWFSRAVEEAGVQDFTWYCLRHTFASRLVMAGVDIRTVAELMGHKTIQMTMRYAHLAPEHNLAAVERLSSYGKRPVKSRTKSRASLPTARSGAPISPTATRTATSLEEAVPREDGHVQ